jgi:hypothetical protein
LIIIEEDMKLGTKRKVTFRETYCNLLNTNKLTKVKLNYLLLSNIKILNERFAYQRQITEERKE